MSHDVVITIPKSQPRAAVLRQLGGWKRPGWHWHFCTNNRPRREPFGRMHFVHAGELIGSLPIQDVVENPEREIHLRRADGSELVSERRYAIRARLGPGEFKEQSPPVPMRGFRGWRYFDHTCPVCSGLGCAFEDDEPGSICATCNGQGTV